MHMYYLNRALNDKRMWGLLVWFILIITIDLFVLNSNWQEKLVPSYSTFLVSKSEGHYAQMIILWLLPIYFIFGPAYWVLSDKKTGNIQSILARTSKKKAFFSLNISAFIFGFFIIITGLSINYTLAAIINHSAVSPNSILSTEQHVDLLKKVLPFNYLQLAHPIITNLIFIGTTAIFTGVISMTVLNLSILLKKISSVLIVSVFIWYLLLGGKYPVMSVFQPFTEYSFRQISSTYLIGIALMIGLMLVIYKWWLKNDEID